MLTFQQLTVIDYTAYCCPINAGKMHACPPASATLRKGCNSLEVCQLSTNVTHFHQEYYNSPTSDYIFTRGTLLTNGRFN